MVGKKKKKKKKLKMAASQDYDWFGRNRKYERGATSNMRIRRHGKKGFEIRTRMWGYLSTFNLLFQCFDRNITTSIALHLLRNRTSNNTPRLRGAPPAPHMIGSSSPVHRLVGAPPTVHRLRGVPPGTAWKLPSPREK
ncbi:hypothetical protein ACS0TY_005675 [Phlomoides rotata]